MVAAGGFVPNAEGRFALRYDIIALPDRSRHMHEAARDNRAAIAEFLFVFTA